MWETRAGGAAQGWLGTDPTLGGILMGLSSPFGASHRGIPSSPALWDVHPATVKVGYRFPPQQALTGTRAQRVPKLCVPETRGSLFYEEVWGVWGGGWHEGRMAVAAALSAGRWMMRWPPTPVCLLGESQARTEEPGKLQSIGWQRVGYDWRDLAGLHHIVTTWMNLKRMFWDLNLKTIF